MLPVAALLPDWLPGEPLCPRDTLGSPQAFDAMHVLRVDDLLSQGVRSGPWFHAHNQPRADSRTPLGRQGGPRNPRNDLRLAYSMLRATCGPDQP